MNAQRPVDDAQLERARQEILDIYVKYGFTGGFMVISENEVTYAYHMTAPWNAFKPDKTSVQDGDMTPTGVRIQSSWSQPGGHEKLEGAAHTICALMDFALQTGLYMQGFLDILKNHGIEVEHVPFGGGHPGEIVGMEPGKDKP